MGRASTRQRRVVSLVLAGYFGILAVVGVVAGLATGSALAGGIAVLIAICVLPFVATGLRINYQRRHR